MHNQEADPATVPHFENGLHDMVTAISKTCKEVVTVTNNDDFEAAADGLLRQKLKPADVEKFGEWWKLNGYYQGKPALKTILQEIKNSAEEPATRDRWSTL